MADSQRALSATRVVIQNEGKPLHITLNSAGTMKIEHVAFNVSAPAEMADWYVTHLGMRIVRKTATPPYIHFLADDGGTIAAVRALGDSGFIATGLNREGVMALKVDADGAVEWVRAYTVYPITISAYDIEAASDGGYLLTGRYAPYVVDRPAWVIKLDPTGALEWQRNYGGGGGSVVSVPTGI